MNASRERTNNYHLLTQEVVSRYGDVAPGVTLSGQLCPACGGGNNRERSFNVTRIAEDGSVRWMCHRASCNFKGSSSYDSHTISEAGRLGGSQEAPPKVLRSVAERVGKLSELPTPVKNHLLDRYHLIEPTILDCGLQWSTAASPQGRGRVFVPLRSAVHSSNGCVLRAIDGEQQPKALTFSEPGAESTLGYFLGGHYDQSLLIVEDVFSAMRCQQYGVLAVALCGTNISASRLEDIAKARARLGFHPYLALDADAFPAAIAKMRDIRRVLPGVNVVKLDKDIKDMSWTEAAEFFKQFSDPDLVPF